MVARIDGRSFSQLTRVTQGFDAPYDTRFRDCMVATLQHLVTACGFSVLFGYTQSDEMSLLFRKNESLFGRKLRKYLSVLAGEASAKLSLTLGTLAPCEYIGLSGGHGHGIAHYGDSSALGLLRWKTPLVYDSLGAGGNPVSAPRVESARSHSLWCNRRIFRIVRASRKLPRNKGRGLCGR